MWVSEYAREQARVRCTQVLEGPSPFGHVALMDPHEWLLTLKSGLDLALAVP